MLLPPVHFAFVLLSFITEPRKNPNKNQETDMAPIPFTAQQPILPGALSAVWLYIIAILAFLLFGFVAIWSIRSLKARFQSQETAEDRKMTLPTHVDSYTPRDVFLPIWRPEVREAAVDVRCEMQEVPLADTVSALLMLPGPTHPHL